MKVCVIVARYAVSGVPLAQRRLAEAFRRAGHQVDYLVGFNSETARINSLEGIALIDLNRPNVRQLLLPIARYLWGSKPDIILSAEDHLNAIVCAAAVLSGSRARIGCSSRVTPFDTYDGRFPSKRWLLKKLVPLLTRRATVLTAVSSGIAYEYSVILPNMKLQVVYNSVDRMLVQRAQREKVQDPWLGDSDNATFVAAGTLAPWKGFDQLIRVMQSVHKLRKSRLLILGEGQSRPDLEKQILSLGLENTVRLVGSVENPYPYFAKADVFVHTARVESLGNVLIEAMACETTVVAVDCPVGPREVLNGGEFGYLVAQNDDDALIRAMIAALDYPFSPSTLQRGMARFSGDSIVSRHLQLLGFPKTSGAEVA